MKTKNICIALLISTGLLAAGCDKSGAKKDESSSDDKKSDDKKKDSKKKDDSDKKADVKSSSDAKPGAPTTPVAPSTPTVAGGNKGASHLPGDCQVAVHFQVAKLMANPSLAKEVVPLIDELLATPSPKDKEFQEFQGFMKDASLDPKKSFQDMAVCVTDLGSKAVWAIALGGDMKPDTIIPALKKHGGKDNKLEPVEVGGVKGLGDKKGTVLQLSDGTIVLAENKDLLTKLIPMGDGAQKLKLDLGKELSFAVSESGMQAAFAQGKKAPDELKAIQHAEGFIDLTSGKASVRLACATPEAAKKLDALITLMKSQFEKQAKGNTFGEEDALKSTQSKIEGSDVVIESSIPAGTLDKAATALAGELRKAKSKM